MYVYFLLNKKFKLVKTKSSLNICSCFSLASDPEVIKLIFGSAKTRVKSFRLFLGLVLSITVSIR